MRFILSNKILKYTVTQKRSFSRLLSTPILLNHSQCYYTVFTYFLFSPLDREKRKWKRNKNKESTTLLFINGEDRNLLTFLWRVPSLFNLEPHDGCIHLAWLANLSFLLGLSSQEQQPTMQPGNCSLDTLKNSSRRVNRSH